ncbi:Gfo/Idh/MocA family oxidoreductase [Polaromonas sp. SM01]|uniref:Gfo/Idh/MocA family protein n=1 Tax=Polaromonas sp. SM01 TaxID=3085630 RepID=UPI0029815D98|nr:Gfo/Idh/MocA family oxidoreductase [Polaromonas sp. SM01]MDW5442059.1 Gfo/Idh/MocA family oxidoreductase [Polaromonas sp. SM01]
MNKSVGTRMRVAVVGAGQASAPHLQSLEDLGAEVELAWVVARSTERLAGLKLPAGTATSTRLEDVLEDPSVQAVLVLTPPNTHGDIVQRLAQAGKHVLVEKPLDVSLDKAEQMVAVCEQHGVKLAVMLQHRMRDAAGTLAQLVAGGDLGSLVSASASVRWWRPQSYYDEPGRGTLARDGGGVLMTQAIHTLDLLLCLTGMPDKVIALASTSALHHMECEDTVVALLHYANGAVANIDATTAAYPGFPEHIALNFTLGSATLEAGELQAELLDGQKIHAGEKQASGSGANLMAFDHQAHRAVLQDFVNAIRSNTDPAVTGRSALQVHRLITAMMASSASGAAVSLLR